MADRNVAGFDGEFDIESLDNYVVAAEQAVLSAESALAAHRVTEATAGTDAAVAADVAEAQATIDAASERFNANGEQLAQTESGAVIRVYSYEDGEGADVFTTDSAANEGNVEFVGFLLESATPGEDGVVTVDVDGDGNPTSGYSLSADGNFSIKQLQNLATSAVASYSADVTTNGATAELAASIKDAIALYSTQNDAVLALTTLSEAVDTYLTALDNAEDAAAVREADVAFYGAVQMAHTAVFSGGDDEDESILVDGARGDSVESLLETLNDRAELSDNVTATSEAFVAAEGVVEFEGDTFTDAKAILDERNALKEAIETAQTDLDELSELATAYETAVAAVEAAEEELGFVIEEIDASVEFGTDEADLFIFDADVLEDAGIEAVTIFDLEAGDVLFLGTDYQLGGETGDNNALEFFLSTNANGDAVVQVENTAFGSASEDFVEITLSGISEDQLSTDGGIISIA